jgi:NADH:ubiquinone oxidoreductase subunit F (NADH-binding)/ferredoxin
VTAVLPLVIRIGQARLTSGLDRHPRLGLAEHRAEFGELPALTAAQLITMAAQVDLRGCGGAGFSVARKLGAVLTATRNGKRRAVVVVNATEGEPGSAKDKVLLCRSPHLVLDGAAITAKALGAREIIIATAGSGAHQDSVSAAVASDAMLRKLARVVAVPDRFISGESGALINALNGKSALPPGTKIRASDTGVGGLPTFLSNAETFAQLAVLAMLGPAGYASAGLEQEPGTVLLTVGGSVARPAVAEVPTGVPLGHVLDICGADYASGVLVGGYHGMWLTPEAAYQVPVSRTALAAAGGTLGAGVVLVLGADCCPLGEVSRVATYLAMQSSGQCGPCKLGLPSVARSLAAIAAGAGGMDELETARRAAAAVRGRGACGHPDGTANFVVSALDAFSADLSEHMFRGRCGRPVRAVLPVPGEAGEPARAAETRLSVDWTRCGGHGLCARLVPELIRLDEHGYPEFLDAPVPFWLTRDARHAVEMCPALALTLTTSKPRRAVPARAVQPPPVPAALPRPGQPPPRPRLVAQQALTRRERMQAELAGATAWIAAIGGSDPAGRPAARVGFPAADDQEPG